MNTLALEKGVKEMNTYSNGYFPQYPYQTGMPHYHSNRHSHDAINGFNGFVPHQTNEYQQMQQNNNDYASLQSNQHPYVQTNSKHLYGNMKDQCQQMKDHHVELKMSDGQTLDGILTEVREDGITLLIGEDIHQEEARQFGGWRYRRYRPRFFPYGRFGGIGFFPYFYPPFFF